MVKSISKHLLDTTSVNTVPYGFISALLTQNLSKKKTFQSCIKVVHRPTTQNYKCFHCHKQLQHSNGDTSTQV